MNHLKEIGKYTAACSVQCCALMRRNGKNKEVKETTMMCGGGSGQATTYVSENRFIQKQVHKLDISSLYFFCGTLIFFANQLYA